MGAMKRGKRRKKSYPRTQSHQDPCVTDRRIVRIDDGPPRKRAAKECQRAMAKLETARAELRRFEQEDQPAFGRWMATNFGALLTEIRENARLLREQETLIRQVENEMMWGKHSNPRRAYAAVMKARENPEPKDHASNGEASADDTDHPGDGKWDPLDDDEDDFNPFEGAGADVPPEDRKAMFDDFVKSVFGVNPRSMNQAEYAAMFAAFEAEIFGKGSRPAPPPAPEPGHTPPGGEEARIKEIYRVLVRRLHPDLRADGDATVSAIWHEVQEAYGARNLDRLETLLALTEMQHGGNLTQTTLSQLRAALAEVNRAYRALRRSIGEAKRDPAWGFCQNPYHGPLEKRIRRDIEADLANQRSVLREHKRILDDWSRPWVPPARKHRKQPGPPEKNRSGPARRESASPGLVQPELFAF